MVRFRRVPYLEKRLLYHFGLQFDYCRNLVLSARRTFDSFLPEAQQLKASLPAISAADFLTAIEQFAQQIHTALPRRKFSV